MQPLLLPGIILTHGITFTHHTAITAGHGDTTMAILIIIGDGADIAAHGYLGDGVLGTVAGTTHGIILMEVSVATTAGEVILTTDTAVGIMVGIILTTDTDILTMATGKTRTAERIDAEQAEACTILLLL